MMERGWEKEKCGSGAEWSRLRLDAAGRACFGMEAGEGPQAVSHLLWSVCEADNNLFC